MDIKRFTVTQLLIASGLAKGVSRSEISRVVGCTKSYITKIIDGEDFSDLVKSFKLMSYDKDTAKYNGVGTLLMESGRLLYNDGERINNGN